MIKKIFLTVFAFLLFSVTSNAKSSSTAPSISMIGDAVSGWGTDVVMSSTDGVNFTLENFTFVNGGAKFRQDSSWSNNWGANAFPSGTGSSNGNNIPVTAGTYNVSFNITTGAYSFTNVVNYDAISISGTAGPGSNSDVSMITGDGINYSLAQYTLTSGTLVFRKDNSATTTWGSANFPTGTATQGGSEIVVSPGTYDITFNKTTGAYSFSFATIGIIGSGTAGGWNTDTLMSTTDGVNYTIDGAVLTTGALKFRKNQAWTVAWGASGFPTGIATLTGGDIPISGGVYSISFNTITGAYNFISGYPVVSLFQTGGTDINFFTTDGVNYFLNNYSISAGDYIFRQSGTNTNTWGASSFPSGNATLGGSSIPVLAGDYNIMFNKVTGVFSFNYLTIGVIGSATPSGWSADTNLTTEDGVIYKLSGLTLGLGELKFRQGNSWDVNWGSSSFPGGTSTNGGSNIVVSKASNFTVTFNKLTGAYYFYDEVNLDAPVAVNMCKGSVVSSLSGSVFAVPGSVVKWYTVATGGIASLTAPSPTTSTLGTKTHYVSQTIGSIEGPRATMMVNVVAVPTEVIGAISSNTAGTTAGTFAAATLAVGPFVGTTTTVSYRVPAFVGANSYFWTVPAGVRIVGQSEGTRTVTQSGENANVLNVNYSGISAGIGSVGAITVQAQNANGCNGTAKSVTIAKSLPIAPAAIVMTDLSVAAPVSGIRPAVKSFAKYMGTNAVLTLTATPSVAATSYEWNLPAGVNQLSGGTSNVITVNFAGVTIANTDVSVPANTNVLRIGVKAVNGVGVSTVSNSALVNPTTTSTSRLLTLTAVAPAAPALKMFDMAASSTVAVTDISKYIGSNTTLTLVGTVAATTLASSFFWELAEGVNVVAGSVLSSSTIMVNFEDVEPGTTSLYVGIKAVNGMGASVKNNGTLLPATSSTATLLKLSAGLPSAAGTVVGSLAICSNQASSVTYTITAAAAKTNLYIITAPAGTTITGGVMNTRTINAVAGATFTVNYPNGFSSPSTAKKTISIQSVNGFGVSATNKVLTLTSNTCTITSRTTAKVAPVAQDFKVIAYPNPSTGVFNLAIESSRAASTTIQVYDMQGRMIESKQVNTNAVEIGGNYTSGIYNVILENAGQAKTIRLIKK